MSQSQDPADPSVATENSKPEKDLEPPQSSESVERSHQKPKRTSSTTLQCPICNEAMISIHQLNRHIDDAHVESADTQRGREDPSSKLAANEYAGNDIKSWIKKKLPAETPSLFSPGKRKTINLDLLDGNRGFGLSDSLNDVSKSPGSKEQLPTELLPLKSASPKTSRTNEITRTHWRQPSITGALSCSHPGCKRTLNIKNGIVNCRKCGNLFCNEHTHCKVRLRNPGPGEGKLPMYDCSANGVWCRSCETCYLNKPDFVAGVEVAVNDVTVQYQQKRSEFIDTKMLRRIKIQKRFIKNANLITEHFIANSKASFWNGFSFHAFSANADPLIAQQKQIVGSDNWQDDSVTHCAICYTNFNFLIRKHHCRLCGRLVCNDPEGERMYCSILLPITSFIEKLPTLNYASIVKQNLPKMLELPLESQDRISLRCCVDCKNDLLHSWKSSDELRQESDREIFTIYNGILVLKNTIATLLPRYRKLVEKISNSDADADRLDLNNARLRLMSALKDFEGASTRFRTQFLQLQDGKLCIKDEYNNHKQLVLNMYQSTIMFLQDNLESFKGLNAKIQENEKKTIEKMEAGAHQTERPRLTKKEVREKREKLMVMKEQTFIVENLIESATKQRKFDEIDLLLGNKNELAKEIAVLEEELGDEGF